MSKSNNLVGIIMGSKSDWPIMKHASLTLKKLKISHESKIVSAHRTPKLLYEYADQAASVYGESDNFSEIKDNESFLNHSTKTGNLLCYFPKS